MDKSSEIALVEHIKELPSELFPEQQSLEQRESDTASRTALLINLNNPLGFCIAESLARKGINIALQVKEEAPEAERKLAELSERYFVKARCFSANCCLEAEMCAIIDQIEADVGSVDILIYMPHVETGDSIDLLASDRWNNAMLGVLGSAFFATKAVLPAMKAKGWGRIINIVSQPQMEPREKETISVMALWGLAGFTQSVAVELANAAITCNLVSIGLMIDEHTNRQLESLAEIKGTSASIETRAFLEKKQLLRKEITPQQVAAMIEFLCSPQADTITGSTMKIDAGATLCKR